MFKRLWSRTNIRVDGIERHASQLATIGSNNCFISSNAHRRRASKSALYNVGRFFFLSSQYVQQKEIRTSLSQCVISTALNRTDGCASTDPSYTKYDSYHTLKKTVIRLVLVINVHPCGFMMIPYTCRRQHGILSSEGLVILFPFMRL